jgi:flagellar basal body rod protein FlgG
MFMDVSMNAPVSGMRAAMTGHAVAAHDVANSNTPGFGHYTPHQVETLPDGTAVSHISRQPNPNQDVSNTDLAEESAQILSNKHALEANSAVIKAKDRMVGELIDLVG